ncbi:MAG TPA: NAD-dependent protein deacetylase [Casimicrobiaceae bacterium]|nr:NAD-dependent protein deacetylase [Casimicrobiaceae bacterium]
MDATSTAVADTASTTCEQQAIDALCRFVEQHPRLFVLTGAGISTDSGIPSYRDADGAWKRSAPILWQDFLGDERARRRYWARSMVGWPIMSRARPNPAHHALADLQATGRIERLVTQNVDGLHQSAGSQDVIELHGSLATAVCLACGTRHARESIQLDMQAAHPHLVDVSAAALADGDAALESSCIDDFRAPVCSHCGGVLKPDVVFFGDSVPAPRVAEAKRALERADAMLVVGSSLMVYSGFRFCTHAVESGKPIAAINLGRTRADSLVALKVSQSCAATLDAVRRRVVDH